MSDLALDMFRRKAKEHGLKITPQRTAIFQELLKAKDHPTAEGIHKRIVRKIPNISFDTVNRTLSTFLLHANFQLPFIDILPAEFGEITIPDVLTFKRTLGWILWLMPLPAFDIDAISRRLSFPALLTRSVHAAASLLAELPSRMAWKPSQWTFYLEQLPSVSVYAGYLMRMEPALREYLVHWRKVKPLVTGSDLKQHGLEPGPRYAEILHQLRAARLDGEVVSREEEIKLLERII